MSTQVICEASSNATFLQALESGHIHSDCLDGRTIDLFGRVPVLANLSARQAKELGFLMSGICGRPFFTSSKSASLQRSLESRLQAKTLTLGSTLYTLTWKPWVTPSGRYRFRLRASVRRTSETDFIGWATPTTRDWKDGQFCENVPINALLGRVVWLAGWPTATATDAKRGGASAKAARQWNSAFSNGINGNSMPINGFWRNADWLLCRDGKWRPVEPGTFPMAHGSPQRVGRLRAYGNAINAKSAQVFIESVMESI